MSASKTLPGTIKTTGTGPLFNIILSFRTHICTFVDSNCPQFATTSATLTYDSEDQLTGKQNADIRIGDSVNITFGNGPIAVGTLESLTILRCETRGVGTWN